MSTNSDSFDFAFGAGDISFREMATPDFAWVRDFLDGVTAGSPDTPQGLPGYLEAVFGELRTAGSLADLANTATSANVVAMLQSAGSLANDASDWLSRDTAGTQGLLEQLEELVAGAPAGTGGPGTPNSVPTGPFTVAGWMGPGSPPSWNPPASVPPGGTGGSGGSNPLPSGPSAGAGALPLSADTVFSSAPAGYDTGWDGVDLPTGPFAPGGLLDGLEGGSDPDASFTAGGPLSWGDLLV